MAQMAENIGTGKVEKLFRFAGSARALYDMSEKEINADFGHYRSRCEVCSYL